MPTEPQVNSLILLCILFCLCAGCIAVLVFLREILMAIRERTRDE